MKFLKGLLYFVLILIGAVLLAALFAPGEKIVERSININAPLNKVYMQVADFENWKHWDPWFTYDTLQQRTMNGTVGEDGYGYSWTSESKDVGNGSMAITSYEGTSKINYHLIFGEGGSANEADGYFTFTENGETTDVTWAMISQMKYPFRLMNYFMDAFLGTDFETGLNNLKDRVENSSDEELGIEPEITVSIITERGVNYAVVREVVTFQEFDDFFGSAYAKIYEHIGMNGLSPQGNPHGLYYSWDTINMQTDVAAAVPVSEVMKDSGAVVKLDMGDASLAEDHISFVHVGDYSASESIHNALGAWLGENEKMMMYPVVEEYIKGPPDVTDPTMFETRITYYFE